MIILNLLHDTCSILASKVAFINPVSRLMQYSTKLFISLYNNIYVVYLLWKYQITLSVQILLQLTVKLLEI